MILQKILFADSGFHEISCEDFKKDCKSAGLTKTSDIILEAKSYITKDTTYSLSPGKTPSGKESLNTF